MQSKLKNIAFCALSAIFLLLAFPKTNFFLFAWVGLVPLMILLESKTGKKAFGWAYLTGVIFFSSLLYWFVYVDPMIAFLGLPCMILYLALYYGAFGFFYSFVNKAQTPLKYVAIPSAWVALEFIRAHFLTGFDWGSLGYSQFKALSLIQIADVTGVSGISFCIVFVNYAIKEWIVYKKKSVLIAAGLLMSVVLVYGVFAIVSRDKSDEISVAVIQANIDQDDKWNESQWPIIFSKYVALTQKAVNDQPDLIIWPETSYPGFLWEDTKYYTQIRKIVDENKIPILFGSVTIFSQKYYNSALLLQPSKPIPQIYSKRHLVPFGEYIPFRSLIPALSRWIPIEDFNVGKELKVFNLQGEGLEKKKNLKFSVLICFEDSIARLVRQFVQKGAPLLINMTNDAWFKDSRALYMHLSASVLRAVENRRSIIRAANTGVSCFINSRGVVKNCVEDAEGNQTNVDGYVMGTVAFQEKISFFTKFGEVFTYLCFGCILMTSFFILKNKENLDNV